MAEIPTVPYRGVLTFWELAAEMRSEPILDALRALNLDRYAPSPYTAAAALKRALVAHGRPAGSRVDHYVRDGEPTPQVACHYSLMTDEYDPDGKPVPRAVGEARILRDGRVQLATCDDAAVAAELQRLLTLTSRVEVGQTLVAVCKAWGGTSMRSTGGLYWLPEGRVAGWRALAAAVARAAPGARVAVFRQVADVDSVADIVAAFSAQVRGRLAEIDGEVNSGKHKEKALARLRTEAAELRTLVGRYEAELGVTLDELREECGARAEVTRATATAARVAAALEDI